MKAVHLGVALGLILLATATTASADSLYLALGAGQTIDGARGGEFNIKDFDNGTADVGHQPPTGYQFNTFCLERSETVSVPGWYDYVINDRAIAGGSNSDASEVGYDSLSVETAYIYYRFWTGSLTGYDYGNTAGQRAADAAQLQLVIWLLEDETTNTTPLNSDGWAWYNAALATTWTDIGGVRVLNLTQNGVKKQDQLVVVPLPPALGLGLLGLVGVVAARRRRRKGM